MNSLVRKPSGCAPSKSANLSRRTSTHRNRWALFYGMTDSPLEGEDLPPMIKRKSGAVTPRDPVVVQFLQGKGSTVLALSRTLCAGSADAALAAASLTAAARGALPGGRSGHPVIA